MVIPFHEIKGKSNSVNSFLSVRLPGIETNVNKSTMIPVNGNTCDFLMNNGM